MPYRNIASMYHGYELIIDSANNSKGYNINLPWIFEYNINVKEFHNYL